MKAYKRLYTWLGVITLYVYLLNVIDSEVVHKIRFSNMIELRGYVFLLMLAYLLYGIFFVKLLSARNQLQQQNVKWRLKYLSVPIVVYAILAAAFFLQGSPWLAEYLLEFRRFLHIQFKETYLLFFVSAAALWWK